MRRDDSHHHAVREEFQPTIVLLKQRIYNPEIDRATHSLAQVQLAAGSNRTSGGQQIHAHRREILLRHAGERTWTITIFTLSMYSYMD